MNRRSFLTLLQSLPIVGMLFAPPAIGEWLKRRGTQPAADPAERAVRWVSVKDSLPEEYITKLVAITVKRGAEYEHFVHAAMFTPAVDGANGYWSRGFNSIEYVTEDGFRRVTH